MQHSGARKLQHAKKVAKKMVKEALSCTSCSSGDYHYYCVDEGMRAAVYRFCENCIKFDERRTEIFVMAYVRLTPDCPESSNHRDIDVWELPSWEDLRDVEEQLTHEQEKKIFQFAHQHDEVLQGDFMAQIHDMAHRDEDEGANIDEEECPPQTVPTLQHLANVALGKSVIALHPEASFKHLRSAMHDHMRQPLIDTLVEASSERLVQYRQHHAAQLEKYKKDLSETSIALEKAIEAYESRDEDEEDDPEEVERIHGMEEIVTTCTSNIEDLEAINVEEEFGALSSGLVAHLSGIAWADHKDLVDLRKSKLRLPDTKLLSFMCKTLRIDSLDLAWNFLNVVSVSPVVSILSHDNLIGLDLSWCKIGNGIGRLLAQQLPALKLLKTLRVKGNNIKPRGFELFSKGLVDNRSLTVLDMSFNDCKVDGSEALASALAENNVIQELHLRSCNIGTNGAFVLARKLRKCESLGELMIADNKVGRLGAAHIARNLKLTSGPLLRAFGWRYGRELDVYDIEAELDMDNC